MFVNVENSERAAKKRIFLNVFYAFQHYKLARPDQLRLLGRL